MKLSLSDKMALTKLAVANAIGAWVHQKNATPPAIVWMMTYNCNASCGHCHYWKKSGSIDENMIVQIANTIAESKTKIVNLTGGEVFLVPNIKDVLILLKKAGKYVRINTNGFLLKEFWDFLMEQKVDSISVSLDGTDADFHDSNRGKKGFFSNSVEALKYIRANRLSDRPSTSVRFVVMKKNIDQISNYIDYFKDIADEVDFQPIHDQETKHAVVDKTLLFDREQEEEVKNKIGLLSKNYLSLNNSYFKGFPDFLFNRSRLSRSAVDYCLPVLFNALAIRPNGDCYVCTQKIGNIMNQPVAEIWQGPSRKGFLKELARRGECSAPCWLNSNSARTPLLGGITKSLVRVMR